MTENLGIYIAAKIQLIEKIEENLMTAISNPRPNYSRPEPPPIANDNPSIHDLVIADVAERKQFGLDKYGTILQAGNGRKGLVDLYQELIDAACYCRLLIEESRINTD